jgi:hypothetical protein
MINCCNHNKTQKKCIRKSDKKVFSLPRRFSRKRCQQGIKGFTMRSSCAPYKDCLQKKGGYKTKRRKKGKNKKNKTKKQKPQFLYNPNDPKKSFDVYIDKDPSDTIPIKYTTVDDVKNTIKKLESLYKRGAYSHKRIWQVGMIMKVRLEAMLKHQKTLYPNAKYVKQRFNLANKYFKFLRKRSKVHETKERKQMVFKL